MGQSSPGEPQKENPESVAAEIGVQGIEALPSRVQRYNKAKSTALDIAKYMADLPGMQATAKRVASCGDYLVFRHYYTVDQVKLHGAQLCMNSLLCPLCAIRRGAKALKAYLDRWECIRAQKPLLRPFLVTLTVKDGDDLEERFKHLHTSQRELWMRKHRGRGSVLDGVEGAVWSYEVKRGSGSGKWHPHLHMIALAEEPPDQAALSAEWLEITGDSFIVDVRPISQEDPVSGFMEVFKYAVKFSDQEPADMVEAFRVLKGKRLIGSAGCFRKVTFGEDLLDDQEGLQGLPFITLFYRYLRGGYSLEWTKPGCDPAPLPKVPKVEKIPMPLDLDRLGRLETAIRLTSERKVQRELPGEKQRLMAWARRASPGGQPGRDVHGSEAPTKTQRSP